MQKKFDLILKLNSSNELQEAREDISLCKINSSLSAKEFSSLLSIADNKVNPRSATANNIVKAIHETLETSPELFWFKSKGLLLATETCVPLDRNRIGITLSNHDYEGIMDGGHNTLAIASFILIKCFGLKKNEWKKWKECQSFWKDNYDDIIAKIEDRIDDFKFSIPIEIISPNNNKTDAIEEFHDHISEICSARNNNVQLRDTAKANQTGTYDYLKEVLNNYDITWKTGEKGTIKCEDVIALCSLPLYYLQELNLLPKDIKKLNKVNIYSGKSQCVSVFNQILTHRQISLYSDGKYELNSDLIKSALDMSEELLCFFDKLYLQFPKMYNRVSSGFGRIKVVNQKKMSKAHFGTVDDFCENTYPEAYIYPFFAGITKLMKYNEDTTKLEWVKRPTALDLTKIDSKIYIEMIKLQQYDPQKVGKTKSCYIASEPIFESILKS